MDYKSHPDYLAAMAEYQAATQVAERANDETGKLRAELSWVRKEGEIRERVTAEAAVKERRETAIARVKEEFPLVPPSLYEHVQDPEALLKVAEEVYKNMEAQLRKNTNSWGGAAGAPGGSSGKPAKKKSADQAYVSDLVNRVNRNEGGPKGAVKEYKDMVWRDRVTPWRESMQGRSQ